MDYHPNLYHAVIDKHTTTGGQLTTLLDVGCGPGPVARALAPHFEQTIGLDPSAGMIAAARSFPNPNSIRFEISTAEGLGQDLDPEIQNGSVDLITAGTAAHWFDMSSFWPRAAQVLKPGGSVAIWTYGHIRVHESVPNHAAIQKAIDDHEKEYVEPYYAPGNFIVKNLYRDLALPWTLEVGEEAFDQNSFYRKDWDGSNEVMYGETEPRAITLQMVEMVLGTASPITRWREAHPELVGTEQDIVKLLVAKIRRLLHEAGAEEGKESIKSIVAGVLLVVKKKA